jgi:hypothetical protein
MRVSADRRPPCSVRGGGGLSLTRSSLPDKFRADPPGGRSFPGAFLEPDFRLGLRARFAGRFSGLLSRIGPSPYCCEPVFRRCFGPDSSWLWRARARGCCRGPVLCLAVAAGLSPRQFGPDSRFLWRPGPGCCRGSVLRLAVANRSSAAASGRTPVGCGGLGPRLLSRTGPLPGRCGRSFASPIRAGLQISVAAWAPVAVADRSLALPLRTGLSPR